MPQHNTALALPSVVETPLGVNSANVAAEIASQMERTNQAVENATRRQTSIDTQYSSLLDILQRDAGSSYQQMQEAYSNIERAERYPTVIRSILSFVGKSEFDIDAQYARVESARANLGAVDSRLRAEGIRRQLDIEAVARETDVETTRFSNLLAGVSAAATATGTELELRRQGWAEYFGEIQGFSFEELQAEIGLGSKSAYRQGDLHDEFVRKQQLEFQLQQAGALAAASKFELAERSRQAAFSLMGHRQIEELITAAGPNGWVGLTENGEFTVDSSAAVLKFGINELNEKFVAAKNKDDARAEVQIQTGIAISENESLATSIVLAQNGLRRAGWSVTNDAKLTQGITDYRTVMRQFETTGDIAFLEQAHKMLVGIQANLDTEIKTLAENSATPKATEHYIRNGEFTDPALAADFYAANANFPTSLVGSRYNTLHTQVMDAFLQKRAARSDFDFRGAVEAGGDINIPVGTKPSDLELLAQVVNEMKDEKGRSVVATGLAMEETFRYSQFVLAQLAETNPIFADFAVNNYEIKASTGGFPDIYIPSGNTYDMSPQALMEALAIETLNLRDAGKLPANQSLMVTYLNALHNDEYFDQFYGASQSTTSMADSALVRLAIGGNLAPAIQEQFPSFVTGSMAARQRMNETRAVPYLSQLEAVMTRGFNEAWEPESMKWGKELGKQFSNILNLHGLDVIPDVIRALQMLQNKKPEFKSVLTDQLISQITGQAAPTGGLGPRTDPGQMEFGPRSSEGGESWRAIIEAARNGLPR